MSENTRAWWILKMRPFDPKKELKRRANKIVAGSIKRCLAPGPMCPRAAIRAHSIQRQGALKVLATKGQVVMLRQGRSLGGEPLARFRPVGTSGATVFGGLCRTHDAEIFRPIDVAPFEMGNPEHSFLHAYRAVLREAHATIDAGSKIQTLYQAKGDLGLIPLDVPTDEGMFAVERMTIAHETWLYKQRFDSLLTTGDYGGVQHDIFEIQRDRPAVAAATLFSLDDVPIGDDVARTALSIIPSACGRTVIVISYLNADALAARVNLKHVLGSLRSGDTYPLSRLILERCENVAFAPRAVDEWDQPKKRIIEEFFNSTILDNNPAFDDPRLDLFN